MGSRHWLARSMSAAKLEDLDSLDFVIVARCFVCSVVVIVVVCWKCPLSLSHRFLVSLLFAAGRNFPIFPVELNKS